MSPLALSSRLLQTQPDSRLVALARTGHEPAFEALVRRYRRPLLTYCERVTPGVGSAEDTLQQALLQAWTALSRGIEVRDARAWLFRIVHNVAVSDLRRSRGTVVELSRGVDLRSADHEAEQRIAVREALAGIAALPGLQREVMVATAVDGLSYEQLASELGLSKGAVRGLIYRARAALRAAAAAVCPVPVLSWVGDHGAVLSEAVAGGGSAGAVGVLLKGGAVVAAAGALATATGIASLQPRHHHAQASVGVLPSAARQAGRVNLSIADADLARRTILVAEPGLRGSFGRLGTSTASRLRGGGAAGGLAQRSFGSSGARSWTFGGVPPTPQGRSAGKGSWTGGRYGGGGSSGDNGSGTTDGGGSQGAGGSNGFGDALPAAAGPDPHVGAPAGVQPYAPPTSIGNADSQAASDGNSQTDGRSGIDGRSATDGRSGTNGRSATDGRPGTHGSGGRLHSGMSLDQPAGGNADPP